jgi:hypothetical protein
MHKSVKLKVSFATALLAVSLAACTPSFFGTLSGAVTQAESFRYTYLKLRESTDGRYLLPVRAVGGGCTTASLTQAELESAIRSHRVVINHPGSSRLPTPGPVTVAFDLSADLGACGMGQIVEFATEDLQVITYDSNHVVTGRSRDLSVSAKYGNDGIARISVKGFALSGQVAGRSRSTGAILLPEFAVSGSQVQGNASDRYVSSSVGTPIADASVSTVADDPARVGINFSFMAKTAANAKQVLLVWDGSLMMRTDL